MNISKETIEKGRLLALAYIRAKAGDAKTAGEMMVAACEGTELDPIMHGVAEGLGFEDPEEDEDESDSAPEDLGVENDDEEEEIEAPEDEDEESDSDGEEEDDEVDAKVEIPASVARLANMKY